jgi:hypothetical protein
MQDPAILELRSRVKIVPDEEFEEIRSHQVKERELKSRIARDRQIKITVIGRKSGDKISIPGWFVLEGDKLYLLPVKGSDTQWYRNVLLAWIRTTVTMAAFGFGTVAFFRAVRERSPAPESIHLHRAAIVATKRQFCPSGL